MDSGLGRPCGACGPSRALTPLPFFRGRARRYLISNGLSNAVALPAPPGQSHLEILRRLADVTIAGRGARGRRFHSSPLQGGGREGGPAPGCAGVPPASREARTRMRAFGPPCRRDAGASGQFTDERNREGPRPGRRAPGVNPPPDLPPSRGEERRPRGEERRRRGPPSCSTIESAPTGDPDSSPCSGKRSEDGVSSAITLGEVGRAGRSHLEILRRRADIAIAGQGHARPPSSLLPLFSGEE